MGMLNMGGSLRYDYSGRKRKAYKKNNPREKPRLHLSLNPCECHDRLEEMNEHRKVSIT